MEIGAQLYTLKTYCQNEKDLARSLEKVAGMGYTCVQLSAIGPIAPERIKTICDDNGLKIVLTHTPEAEVHGRPEETIEKHRIFGCKYIGIGSLPERYRNPDFLPYFAEDFGPAALFLQAHDEVAQRDPHVHLLQVAGLVADIALVLLLVEVEAAVRGDDPPGLFIDGGRRPAHHFHQVAQFA